MWLTAGQRLNEVVSCNSGVEPALLLLQAGWQLWVVHARSICCWRTGVYGRLQQQLTPYCLPATEHMLLCRLSTACP